MDKSKQFVGGRPDVHHHASGRAVKPARSSNANPAFSTPCSSSGWPMIWRPSGRPKASRPAGTDIAGRPARLAGAAKTKFRSMALGASDFSTTATAPEGGVGGRRTLEGRRGGKGG